MQMPNVPGAYGAKRAAAGIGVSAAIVIQWVLESYTPMPDAVIAAVIALVAAAGGYLSDK